MVGEQHEIGAVPIGAEAVWNRRPDPLLGIRVRLLAGNGIADREDRLDRGLRQQRVRLRGLAGDEPGLRGLEIGGGGERIRLLVASEEGRSRGDRREVRQNTHVRISERWGRRTNRPQRFVSPVTRAPASGVQAVATVQRFGHDARSAAPQRMRRHGCHDHRLSRPQQHHEHGGLTPAHPASAASGAGCRRGRRYRPVWDSSTAATCSGVPWTTTWPPASPASGPRSTIQSARFTTSR